MSEALSYAAACGLCRDLGWNLPRPEKFGSASSRYGVTWTPAEERSARNMFEAGHNIRHIAIVHGRDEGGVRSKLRSRGWYDDYADGNVKRGTNLDAKYDYSFLNFQPASQHTEEPSMNYTDNNQEGVLNNSKPIVEQVTMVRGQDVRKLKPKHLIDIIREIKAEIVDLDNLSVQSKYIDSRLAQLQTDLGLVIEVLDTM